MSRIWTRQIGAARVAVIGEATGRWPITAALADVPEEAWRPLVETDERDRILVSFNLTHVALRGASILVDTGFGEYARGGVRPPVPVEDIALAGDLEEALAALGVRPEDVTHVLITHSHGDHILGATRTRGGQRAPAFPNARYYLTAEEWAFTLPGHPSAEAVALQKAALEAAGVVELVEGEREIAPGVTFLHAPGETPGHAVVRVADGGEVAYVLGDLFHLPAEFRHLDWAPPRRDRQTLRATRQRLLPRFVAERALLVVAHLPFPGVGHVVPEGETYRWVPLAS
ncbi:MAG TPA: MBL fold metallo-hydrolase [Chloroflexota bacterium]